MVGGHIKLHMVGKFGIHFSGFGLGLGGTANTFWHSLLTCSIPFDSFSSRIDGDGGLALQNNRLEKEYPAWLGVLNFEGQGLASEL